MRKLTKFALEMGYLDIRICGELIEVSFTVYISKNTCI